MEAISPDILSRDLRDRCGLKRSYAWQLATGRKVPALRLAVTIEDILGIKARFWVDRTSQVQTDPATGIAAENSRVSPDGGMS